MPVEDAAVLCADLHLQERTWVGRGILGDSQHSLYQVARYAMKHRLPVIGAGDLIDKNRNTSAPIVAFSEALRWLESVDLPFHYIQGQHEFADTPWLEIGGRSYHMHGKCVEVSGVPIYGLDYTPAGQLQEALDKIEPSAQVLIAHQVWGDFMGDIANPQGGFHDVPVVSLMFTGDYHQYESVKTRGKDGQELRVISPGSACMQSIDEPEDKFFFVLKSDLSLRRVRLKTRRKIDAGKITSEDDMGRFLARLDLDLTKAEEYGNEHLPKELRTPLLRIKYTAHIENAARRIMKAVDGRAHVFLKETPPEKPEVVERRKERQKTGRKHATTLGSKLPDYLRDTDREHLLGPCQRLLDSHDVAGELQRMRQEALSG